MFAEDKVFYAELFLSVTLILAPMEGLADALLRQRLTGVGGYQRCVSEFIRVTSTLLSARYMLRKVPELTHGARTASGVPVTVQFLGSDPACMADNAARAVEVGAPAIDLNFGCPAPTVNKHRGGAALLDEPELIHQIIAAVRAAVPNDIPVSAKKRLGIRDTGRALEIARAIAAAKPSEMTVHARTRIEGYRPPAHWEWLARIREAVNVPVIANGEVWTLDDYREIRRISGCDAVMLGRGAVADPGLARQIQADLRGEAIPPMPWPELRQQIAGYFADCCAHAPHGHYPVARLKQWLRLIGLRNAQAAGLFDQLRSHTERESIASLLQL